ncbi:hypothetical protein MTO96_023729 [Rhipicephalus appendiculatus]
MAAPKPVTNVPTNKQTAAPKRPLKSILRHSSSADATQPPVSVHMGDVGSSSAPTSDTDLHQYDPHDRSNQAAMASFVLCALCCVAVLVSAASFYASRTDGDAEVTHPEALDAMHPANVSEEVIKATPDARVGVVHVTSAQSWAVTDAEDTGDEEWFEKNETPAPIAESEEERAPMSLKYANFSK